MTYSLTKCVKSTINTCIASLIYITFYLKVRQKLKKGMQQNCILKYAKKIDECVYNIEINWCDFYTNKTCHKYI